MGTLRRLRQHIATKYELGPYQKRLKKDWVVRPHYGYCIYNAAVLAKLLGQPRISVLELGVAGGNGLLAMELHAKEAEKATGVQIDVYGFDTGEGLPAPVDYRDLPYHWKGGFFKMDVAALDATAPVLDPTGLQPTQPFRKPACGRRSRERQPQDSCR